MIDEARADGIDVTFDTYPYLAGATYLHAFLPSWIHEGGAGATIERLRDSALRERLRVEMEETGSDGFHEIPMDWSIVVISNGRFVGRSIADAAAAEGRAGRSTSSATCSSRRSSACPPSCTSATRRTCARS